jgi:hypothetical protein
VIQNLEIFDVHASPRLLRPSSPVKFIPFDLNESIELGLPEADLNHRNEAQNERDDEPFHYVFLSLTLDCINSAERG